MSSVVESLPLSCASDSMDEFAAFLENEIETENTTCSHPMVIRDMCTDCANFVEEAGQRVAFNYISRDLRLDSSEIDRIKSDNLKHLLKQKKLILVLDLDHTLVNTVKMADITPEEQSLMKQVLEDQSKEMLTKLRPFVGTFLKEANDMFEMYIYTMGQHAYAMEIAQLLDPEGLYFPSKVLSQSDCTVKNQKGLDVILGTDNVVIILDDTQQVWQNNKDNLIVIERYQYFGSSARQFCAGATSLLEMQKDESEEDGVLASVLKVLKRAHDMFYDTRFEIDLPSRNVKQILKIIKQEILEGCNIVFSRVFPCNVRAEEQPIWKLAEQLGATCYADMNDSVTHVVAAVCTTKKAEWARANNKFLVTAQWIEAAHYLWRPQKEEDFPVLNRGNKR